MAEIKIEKKNAPMWPWILVALAFIIILIYLFYPREERFDRDEMTSITSGESYAKSDTLEVTGNATAVLAFVNYIHDDQDKMNLDREFTNEAMVRLTNATNAMADEINFDIKKDMVELKSQMDKISTDPFETTNANSIRSAAGILAGTLQNIQRNAFSGLAQEADVLKNSAENIQPNMMPLDQKEAIKNYFIQASELLEKMNPNLPELSKNDRA